MCSKAKESVNVELRPRRTLKVSTKPSRDCWRLPGSFCGVSPGKVARWISSRAVPVFVVRILHTENSGFDNPWVIICIWVVATTATMREDGRDCLCELAMGLAAALI